VSERIRIDYSGLFPFLKEEEIGATEERVRSALETLEQGKGPGGEYTGWLRYPESLPASEVRRMENLAEEVRAEADAFVVIGIGGSYLGARAVIEGLSHGFPCLLSPDRTQGPLIFFAGQNLTGTYLEELLEVLEDRSLYVNVISKSGTTTEPGLAFRVFRKHLVERYGRDGAAQRIISTTDAARGALRKVTDEEGYRSFVIPENIGGRFSVLTPVGLFPIAVAGIPIDTLLEGAASMIEPSSEPALFQNPASLYAGVRNLLLEKGHSTEILVSYDPKLQYFAEWWKQLFGESEGKDGRGIFPASVLFTSDLHSMGQWIQEGRRTIFETVIHLDEEASSLQVPADTTGLEDGLGYLEGRTWPEIQDKAYEGTKMAHHQGGVPVLVVETPRRDAYYLGQLIYFFQKACGISGYLLGVNPFDQPGVEAYKQNMFALLGKPGFENKAAALKASSQGLSQGKRV
jgi:glucose-6-phosphate isomerase